MEKKQQNEKKWKNSTGGILILVLLCLLILSGYFGWMLYRYYAEYSKDREQYDQLREEVIQRKTNAFTEEENEQEAAVLEKKMTATGLHKTKKVEEEAPFTIDWEALHAINQDIIGWVYFTGLPQISYPVLQAEDNSYYVNRTFDLSSDTSKAGSIFMDYRMNRDFSSPYSIIYGHNVRDGSMLSDLGCLKEQELYDQEPYFWVLTPSGNYCYQVFSIFQCHRSADVFQKSFDDWDEEFFNWIQELKARNLMQGDMELSRREHVILFSTCVPNSYDRTIVCGKCISKEPPPYGAFD